MKRLCTLAVAALLAGIRAADAQPFNLQTELEKQLGTLSVGFIPNFVDGHLRGCGLEFNILAKDWIYKKGTLIKVGGQFGLMAAGGTVGTILKVIVHDIDLKTTEFKPSPPATAYFIGKSFDTSARLQVGSSQSDTPGAIFVISQLQAFGFLADGLKNDRVKIAFARQKGASDIHLIVETDVLETSPDGTRKRGPGPTLEFFECAKVLMEQAK